jgi:hypothetical protein
MSVVYRLQANISTEAGRQLSAVCNDSGMSQRSVLEKAIEVAFIASVRGLALEELRELVNGLPSPLSVVGVDLRSRLDGDSPTLTTSPTLE